MCALPAALLACLPGWSDRKGKTLPWMSVAVKCAENPWPYQKPLPEQVPPPQALASTLFRYLTTVDRNDLLLSLAPTVVVIALK